MSALKEENYNPLENFKYQIIGGKIISMAPLADQDHGITSQGLSYIFTDYLRRKNCKKCRVYHDNAYLRLDIIAKEKNIKLPKDCKNDKFRPDVMVVCDKSIDTLEGVIGAPKLVVEVSSKGTVEYDITTKKEVYALIGVEEYWIVSPYSKTIEIYVLDNGVYNLYGAYYKYEKREIEAIEEEKEYLKKGGLEIITEFSPYSFPDLKIKVDDVFDDLIGE